MAIKDIIVPGFVGTSTIKWIVTRGFSIGAAPAGPDTGGFELRLPVDRLHVIIPDGRLQSRQPAGRLHAIVRND